MRIGLYEVNFYSSDETTQRKGVVGISLLRADSSAGFLTDSRERQEHTFMMKSWPIRWSSLHIILPPGPIYHVTKAATMLIVGNEERLRTRFYEGYNLETKYKLMCFGINVADFPVTGSGTLKNKVHNQFLNVWNAVEQSRKDGIDTSAWVVYPGTEDVLFGKGGIIRHQGNLNFQCIMEMVMGAYTARSNRKMLR